MTSYYVTYIRDSIGNNYLGIKVPNDTVDPFLIELKEILNDEYDKYVDLCSDRNSGEYHITVINVSEYNSLAKHMGMDKFINSLTSIFNYEIDDLDMRGIGTATKNNNTAYFIVCDSEKLDAIRNRYELSKRDLHVTLGFDSKDVFGVPKNEVIKKDGRFLQLLRQNFNKDESWEFLKGIDGYTFDKYAEIIPISITDSNAKFKIDKSYFEIKYSPTTKDLIVVSEYDINEELPRLPHTEIVQILNKN